MKKTTKQHISLILVVFLCQLLFPQYSNAAIISTLEKQNGLGKHNNSILLVVNSPQPVLSDEDGEADMAQDGVRITVSDGKSATSVTVASSADQADEVSEKESIEDIKAYVLAEAKKRGLNTREVELIVKCESTWNPNALHTNRNGSIDAGLWQINSIHKSLTLEEKLDYKIATEWALEKRLNDGNWSAWSCARRMGIM